MSKYGGVITGDAAAGAAVGYSGLQSPQVAYGDDGSGFMESFGKGTSARRAVVIWGVATAWLVLAWYAARSY